jgi:RimJ/RimL family protein N-acetyltransferase
VIAPGERIEGTSVYLRLATLADCTLRYVNWLADSDVNVYLETRWSPQTLESVRAFVAGMLESRVDYLFAIMRASDDLHIGNIKVGPIHSVHAFADVSYFIGDRSCWGRGYATEAIRLATDFGFGRLGLHRVQAGCYDSNRGSLRALEKAGLRREGTFREQLITASGGRDDCHRYAILKSEWLARSR